MDDSSYTIAQAAEAARVGIETVRYYERRGLIAQPTQKHGAFRRYGGGHVARIRFIKRAQDLGFSLSEIGELLTLQDGAARTEVQRIAAARLAEIRSRLKDLRRMERTLAELLEHCRHGGSATCPIIDAIKHDETGRATDHALRSRLDAAAEPGRKRNAATATSRTGALRACKPAGGSSH